MELRGVGRRQGPSVSQRNKEGAKGCSLDSTLPFRAGLFGDMYCLQNLGLLQRFVD